MSQASYKQFCPVAMACEVLEPRWTLLILCEIWSGSTHFNEIRRGVPRMSPTLLSTRLKQMETRELISRHVHPKSGEISYRSTDIGIELQPIVHALGKWAHRNIDSEVTLEHLDARLLMWNIRRKVNAAELPNERTVIQFIFPELQDCKNYWLISKPDCAVDLCWNNPGMDVDLYVTAELKALTSAWLGLSKLESEIAHDRIKLIGDKTLGNSIGKWMAKSLLA